MAIKHSIMISILAMLLSAGALADQQRHSRFAAHSGGIQHRTFGFTGDDSVFRVDESTLVHKRRGGKGTLSDIKPGTRIGFYPGSDASSQINEIWILPRNWKAKPGYAVKQDQ